jgi:hypothetical protein
LSEKQGAGNGEACGAIEQGLVFIGEVSSFFENDVVAFPCTREERR